MIAVYARRGIERRAVDLAMTGLAVLGASLDHPPGRVRIPADGRASFTAESLGVVRPERLARPYRAFQVAGLLLTTHSLVAQETMASGLPVVELEGDNVGSALGTSGDLVALAARRPDAIA